MKYNILSLFLLLGIFLAGCNKSTSKRQLVSLNGQWDFAVSLPNSSEIIPPVPPPDFQYRAPVPGLVDMATETIDSIGVNRQNRYFWYRKTFTLAGPYPDKVILKINKAKYGTWVFVNGKFKGKNEYCFTPTFMDIKELLKEPGQENELIIAVGSYHSLPDTIINGWDFEKTRYIPGIYDDVGLILANDPFIRNVQVVPDIKKDKIKVVIFTEVRGNPELFKFKYLVTENASGDFVTAGFTKVLHNPKQLDTTVLTINIERCHLWTPEDPFLYNLVISTPGDDFSTNFGMREFYFDTISKRAMLNGKPYYMRGTNVCIYRFFEDHSRDALPWDKEWVRKLHETFKSMHWNSIRYCIGFPPEIWYDIADETGFLIQDEFPVWYLSDKEKLAPNLKARHLAAEYSEWTKERWNHPCVVIWDAQNETYTEETGKAIGMVRNLDFSKRPWDNGWSPPQLPSDVIETHPYSFFNYQYLPEDSSMPPDGVMKDHFSEAKVPFNGPEGNNARIINEYGWLWLNRDGSPTTLTDRIYATLFKDCTTAEARFEVYARYLGMMTEYWRSHRQCTGVLHFCGLGYSRTQEPRGQTSDHFIDIKNLVLEPNFVKYVRPAFSPVGLMIDKWDIIYKSGEEVKIPIAVINDTYENWDGEIKLSLIKGEQILSHQTSKIVLEKLGRAEHEFSMTMPSERENYSLVAELEYNNEPVRSIREFEVR
jgi:beta-galactosidase